MNQERKHRIIPRILGRARKLRQPLTPPEQKLWRHIRNRQLGGFRFRRQYPIGRYVVDFYCADCRLVVEVDGDSHGEQVEYDEKRTKELKEHGYRIIRFTNRDVLKELENVLEMTLYACEKSKDRPSPRPSP